MPIDPDRKGAHRGGGVIKRRDWDKATSFSSTIGRTQRLVQQVSAGGRRWKSLMFARKKDLTERGEERDRAQVGAADKFALETEKRKTPFLEKKEANEKAEGKGPRVNRSKEET